MIVVMGHRLTIAALCAITGLAGCAQLGALWPPGGQGATPDAAAPATGPGAAGATRPRTRPGADGGAGDDGGDDDDADAANGGGGALRSLGTSVATLGDPARPGLWVQTPRAGADTRGRVRATGDGTAIEVTVIAAPGAGGSRLSLGAMRALGADPAGLVEIEVLVP